MFYLVKQWKKYINRLRMPGIHDPKMWATIGGNEVMNSDLTTFGIHNTRSELRLILLFK